MDLSTSLLSWIDADAVILRGHKGEDKAKSLPLPFTDSKFAVC